MFKRLLLVIMVVSMPFQMSALPPPNGYIPPPGYGGPHPGYGGTPQGYGRPPPMPPSASHQIYYPHDDIKPLPPSNEECPKYPVYYAEDGYPAPYPPYPGIAYETSYTTAQISTAVVVAIIFFTVVGIAVTNTSRSGCCHAENRCDCEF